MKARKGRLNVYPLYPKAKRFLVAMSILYGLVLAVSVRTLVNHHHDAQAGVAVGVAPLYGVLSLLGLVAVVWLYAQGVPPPQGMTPMTRRALPGESEASFYIQSGGERWTTHLVGEEARPINAVAPAVLMVIMTCCCVPAGWVLIRIING